MLDTRKLQREATEIKQALAKKKFALDTDRLAAMLSEKQELQLATEAVQQSRNKASQAIGKAMADGKNDEARVLKSRAEQDKTKLTSLKTAAEDSQRKLKEFLLTIPNVPHESVPEGDSEDSNQIVRTAGTLPNFDFAPKDHVELGEQLGLLDFEAASRVAGSRFSVLRGPLARLHRALAQFMLYVHTKVHNYEEFYVPFIATEEALYGTGQLPKFRDDQFKLSEERNRYLIATAEIPLTNIVRDQILEADELPKKLVSHTPCFRKEAGSYGKDVKGLIRQHQFEKVELVQIVKPSESWQALDGLLWDAESILVWLGLPYRVVTLCGGDLGFAAAKTYDLEVWMPGQQRYREISSCSNFLDFQARRMQTRWRNSATGKLELVHTLNGSALAIGRTLAALLENNQDAEGRIRIPKALSLWMDGIDVIE